MKAADVVEDASGKRRLSSPRSPGRRLQGALLHKIGLDIVSGVYPPGTILAGEIAFAGELEVSRGAYREAMRVLASKGLIESRPKCGTRILSRDRWNILDPDVLSWAFSGAPDLDLVRDIFELRAVIEPEAARLAAARRTKSDLRAIRDALARMRKHALTSELGRAADRDFHDAILRATNNQAIVTLAASVGAAVSWTTLFKHKSKSLPRNAIPDHALVYEAIAEGNGDDAANHMRTLVNLALEDTRAALAHSPAQRLGLARE